jgi:hypothetical protein
MNLTYIILDWILLFLGVMHCVFTFKKYKQLELEAIWFFSAGLGLILCGLLNYINLNFIHPTISIITTGANLAQVLLTFVLAYNFPKGKTIFALVLVVLLLICSIVFVTKERELNNLSIYTSIFRSNSSFKKN